MVIAWRTMPLWVTRRHAHPSGITRVSAAQNAKTVSRSACYCLQGDRVQTGSRWVHDLAASVRDEGHWSYRFLQVCSNFPLSRALSVDFGAGNTEDLGA